MTIICLQTFQILTCTWFYNVIKI